MKYYKIKAWCILVVLALSGCASTLEGPQSKAAIDRLQVIRVEVQQDESFSVRKSRNERSPLVIPLFGLIGAGIEAAARSSSDSSLADTFTSTLIAFNAKQILEGKLQEQLIQSKRFAVTSLALKDESTSGDIEGLLQVEMDEWGLRPCLAGQSDERMQVFAKAEGTLKSLPDKTMLWSKDVTHLEQDCHALEDLRDKPGLLSSILSRSFEGLAGKIVSDVLYP
jgi:hypothetical protein